MYLSTTLCNYIHSFHICCVLFETQVAELHQWIEWLDTLRIYRRNKVTGTVSDKEYLGHNFVKGWQVSLASFARLAQQLVGGGHVKCLLLRQVTQDHVENGFSSVRRHGGFNDRSSLSVNFLLGSRPLGKNCEDDCAEVCFLQQF